MVDGPIFQLAIAVIPIDAHHVASIGWVCVKMKIKNSRQKTLMIDGIRVVYILSCSRCSVGELIRSDDLFARCHEYKERTASSHLPQGTIIDI